MPDEKPGAGAGEGTGDGEKPTYVTQADLQKAIDGRLGRFEKNIGKTLETKLTEVIARIGGTPSAEGDDDAPADGGGKKAAAPAGSIEEIAARVKSLETENRNLKRERAENDKRAKAAEERDALRGAFKKLGAREEMLDDLVTARCADGVIARDSDGAIMWRDKEKGDISVEEGAKAWLGSDRGKAYLPASNTRGSSLRPGPNGVDPNKPAAPLDDQSLLDHVL